MTEGFFINNTPYIRLTLANEAVIKNEWFILIQVLAVSFAFQVKLPKASELMLPL